MSELDATFKPFENNIDQKKTISYLKTATKNTDDGELFFERTQNESFLYDNRKLKNSSFISREVLVLELLKEKELLTLILQILT